jgi:hypothetical protein
MPKGTDKKTNRRVEIVVLVNANAAGGAGAMGNAPQLNK